MEKQLGARNEDLAWNRLSAFTDCVYCLGPVLGAKPSLHGGDSADTFPAGAETAACCTGAGYGLAFLGALSSRRGAQKLPRGWSRSDEPP